MLRLFVLAIISCFFFISCREVFGKRIRGSGNITTQDHSVTGYNSVDVSGAIDVYIKQDSAQHVKVVTDDNLQEFLSIREEGGILHIEVKRNYNLKPSSDIKVYVSGPVFRKFDASGACDFYTENQIVSNESIAIELSGASDAKMDLKAPRITGDLTGAGSLTLKGETKDLELDGTGSSTLKCVEMLAENVNVDITGAGDAEVFASVKLDVSVTGSGSVKYKGNANVSQKVSGAGSVRKID